MTERELCEAAIEVRFAQWVALLEPCFYHDDGYREQQEHVQTVFDYFDVPHFWREPVRVLAQGAGYYGADAWMYEQGVWTAENKPFG